MVTQEGVMDVADEIAPLLREHYAEVNSDADLRPDWSAYLALEERGLMRLFTVREDGLLIGYAGFILSPMLHRKGSLSAHCDLVYIHPSHRKGYLAMTLIRHCEHAMREAGAIKIMWGVKVHKDWSKVLERLGYQAEEIILSKTFKE